MQFDRLREGINDIKFKELRVDKADYFEAVATKDKLVLLTDKLEGAFGQAVWPAKDSLSSRITDVINDFGGIRDGQTLYFYREEKYVIFAMLWPWMDGEHVTLKMGQK